MGCFWGAERMFWQAEGVYTTAVGYAGGITPNPTYEEVCSGMTGHAEVVLVGYDVARTSYEEMLKIFWEGHDPTQGMRQGNDVGTQYRSLLLWRGEDQRAAAERVPAGLPGAAHRGRARRASRPSSPPPTPRTLLLRRGLPPAVPGQEPRRLLRARAAQACPARSGWGSRRPAASTAEPVES